MKSCNFCKSKFAPKHFNQTLCSDDCRNNARREARAKYKKTDKGLVTTRRWQKSERFKANEKVYRDKETARAKAVGRVMRYVDKHAHAKDAKKRRDSIYIRRTQGRLRVWWENASANGCRSCGSFNKLGVDHIVPISRGGTDAIDNLQALCHSCNAKKGSTRGTKLPKMQG